MSPRILLLRPPRNPLLQFLYFVVGGILVIGAVLMGAVILAFALGVALVVGIVIWARVWWLKRKLERSGMRPGPGGFGAGPDGRGPSVRDGSRRTEIIDVEYTVVEDDDDRTRPD